MRITLRAAILRAGTTQRRLARQLDYRENRLSSIVQGWVTPRPEERQAIAAALGRSERGLFRNVEPAAALIQSGDAA